VGIAITVKIAVAGPATGVLPNKKASPEPSGRGFFHMGVFHFGWVTTRRDGVTPSLPTHLKRTLFYLPSRWIQFSSEPLPFASLCRIEC
jgi:hypothetical protein